MWKVTRLVLPERLLRLGPLIMNPTCCFSWSSIELIVLWTGLSFLAWPDGPGDMFAGLWHLLRIRCTIFVYLLAAVFVPVVVTDVGTTPCLVRVLVCSWLSVLRIVFVLCDVC